MLLEEGKYFLYRHIRCDTNEVFYIGIGTKQVENSNSSYYRAYTKHGRNKHWKNIVNKTNYIVEILLESNNREFIIEKEKEFILIYGRKDLNKGTLVNFTDGGEGNINASLELRNRFSNIRKGTSQTKDWIEKRIAPLRGRKKSKEEIKKGWDARRREGEKRGYLNNPENYKKFYTIVLQYDLNNNLIKEWESISIAARTLNINASCIANHCAGRYKSFVYKGFIWKYKDKLKTKND